MSSFIVPARERERERAVRNDSFFSLHRFRQDESRKVSLVEFSQRERERERGGQKKRERHKPRDLRNNIRRKWIQTR